MLYAIIETGGKQYRVAENDVLKIEKLDAEVGSVVQFDKVLVLAAENGMVRLGNPLVSGAKISAEVMEQKKDTKIIVFKKKRRHNYRRKNGHRQLITVVRILDVSGNGSVEKKTVAKKIILSKKVETESQNKEEISTKEKATKKQSSTSDTKKSASKTSSSKKKAAEKK